MHKALLAALASTALLSTGCEQQPVAGETAEVDGSQAEQAIGDTNQRWLALVKQKDAAAIANLYSEEGAFMAPNAPIALGRPAIQQGWQNLLDLPEMTLTFTTDDLDLSGAADMAIDRGTYQFTANPEGGAIEDTGKYVVVWRNIDGEWKVTHDIFNSDSPAG